MGISQLSGRINANRIRLELENGSMANRRTGSSPLASIEDDHMQVGQGG